jgi:mono/diheme cytochrome c family protein
MTSEPNQPASIAADEAEPKAGSLPAPILLIGLFALIAFWGLTYLENHAGGFDASVYMPYESADAETIERPAVVVDPKVLGQRIFMANCSVCHQGTGLGQPGTFPPLAGSEWVNAKSPTRVIRIVLNGLTGPIKVKDQAFNNTMVSWKPVLNDTQIAAVLTFVRGNKEWGNDAPAVPPEEVAAMREKVKARDNAFTPDELLKLPEGQ